DAADPHDVGIGRQHVSSLSHERDDAENGIDYVQRVGARRLPESVLAQCRPVGAVAAGAGADRAGRDVPEPRAAAGPPVGARVRSRVVSGLLSALAVAIAVSGCRDVDVVTETYATLSEAQTAGAADR